MGGNYARALLVAFCLGLALCGTTGCKDSDALKEILWDQLAGIIDLNNEEKYYINDDTAALTSELLSSTETSDTAQNLNKTQNLVVYSSTPNNDKNYRAKQSLWSATPDYRGIEASAGVAFYRSDDPAATEQELEDEEQEEEPQEDTSTTASKSAEKGSDGKAKGSTPSKTSDNVKNQEASGGGGQGGEEDDEPIEGSDATDPKGNVDDDLTGDYVDPPKVSSIAAYGNAAVLVQMIGGAGALAAADKELLGGDFTQVFSDEGVSRVATGWSGDGSEASSIKTDAIIESGAQTVLVYSGSELTKAEKRELNAAGVTVSQIRPFTNTTYLKKDAELIGDMLEGSEALAEGWNSVKVAEDYVDYLNDLIAEVCTAANGGAKKLAGSRIYELKNTTKYSFNASAKFTLLLDGYDTSATYASDIDGWQPVATGVALSTIGWATSPTSYYIQAGGLINNAAAKTSATSSGQVVAWQFRQDSAKAAKSKWNYASGGLMDQSTNLKGTDGWDMCLFTTRFSSDFSQADFSMNSTFGSSNFPVAIATTRQIKDEVIANSKDPDGIYHPYGPEQTYMGIVFGKFTEHGSMIQSTIGVDTDVSTSANLFEDEGQIPSDALLVSPCGLFSSWTDDASPESFLEAAWVNDVVNAESASVGWKDKVREFYQTFYRYDLSSGELATIEAGAAR